MFRSFNTTELRANEAWCLRPWYCPASALVLSTLDRLSFYGSRSGSCFCGVPISDNTVSGFAAFTGCPVFFECSEVGLRLRGVLLLAALSPACALAYLRRLVALLESGSALSALGSPRLRGLSATRGYSPSETWPVFRLFFAFTMRI